MNNYQSYSAYVPQPEETEPTSSHVSRTITGTNRVTFKDGVITEQVVSDRKASSAELNPHHGTDHFGAKAHNPNGTPVIELLPSTVVTLDGVEAPVSTFVAMGRIHKGADGTYSESAGPAQVEAAANADYLPMIDSHMEAVNEALATVPQSDLDGLMAYGIGVAVKGLDPRTLVSRYTQVSGLGGEEGAAKLAVMQNAYQPKPTTP
jgi:hypothetical protein